MTIARSVVLFYTDRNTTPVSVVVTCPGNNKSFHKKPQSEAKANNTPTTKKINIHTVAWAKEFVQKRGH